MRPAVFLDRDGTLIEDRGHLADPGEIALYPATIPALRRLQERFRLFIVTNQSGIAKGLLRPKQVDEVNQALVDCLARNGIRIDKVYCCPHQRSDTCACIKPKPHFLQQAAREFEIGLTQSFTVGDHPHDEEFGRNAGATGIYLLTGHGLKHREELWPNALTAADIGEAADVILQTTA